MATGRIINLTPIVQLQALIALQLRGSAGISVFMQGKLCIVVEKLFFILKHSFFNREHLENF